MVARIGRWVCSVVAGLVGTVLTSAAIASPDWKDGCPAYFPAERFPDYVADVPKNTGAGNFGILPDLDSPLGSSRVGAEGWLSNATQRSSPDGFADKMLGLATFAQVSLRSGPTLAVRYAGGYGFGQNSPSGYWQSGNFQVFVGYRETGYLLGPMFRAGGAIRFGGGGEPFSGNDSSLIAKRERLGALAPFRGALFGFDRPLGITAEGRVELVGCQAPFVDLRVDIWTWDAGPDDPRVMDVPLDLAAGGYLIPAVAIFGSFGLELRTPQSALLATRVIRAGLGLDGQFLSHTLRIGARAGASRGNALFGYDVSLVVTFLSPWWKDVPE